MINKKRVLFFSPYQAIHQHSFLERKIAEILEGKGFEITAMLCDGILQTHCLAMSAVGVKFSSSTEQKKAVCAVCKSSRDVTWKNADTFFISDLWSGALQKEFESVKSQFNLKSIEEFEYLGLKLGRLCAYEFIIRNKLTDLKNLSLDQKIEYENHFSNTLKTLLSLVEWLKNNTIDYVVIYNTNYSTNSVVREYCTGLGIKVVFLHGGLDFNKIYETTYASFSRPEDFMRERIEYFEKNIETIVVDESRYTELVHYCRLLFEAKNIWVYSSKKTANPSDVLNQLGLSSQKPTALLATSSTDELFSTDLAVMDSKYLPSAEMTFQNQIVWLEKTIEYFTGRPEWQLVVRIHPREYPNKRESLVSHTAKIFEDMLKDLPPNIFLNLPTDNISIYDLFECIDLNICSWSSVGLESAILGIPTISCSRKISLYPNAYVTHFRSTAERYFKLIEEILSGPLTKDLELTKKAYKWLLFDHHYSLIEFNMNNYWKERTDLFYRVCLKLRRVFNGSPRSYNSYSRQFTILPQEVDALLALFLKSDPVYLTKQAQEKELSSSFESKFSDFLKAFDEHLGIKLIDM